MSSIDIRKFSTFGSSAAMVLPERQVLPLWDSWYARMLSFCKRFVPVVDVKVGLAPLGSLGILSWY